MLLDDDAQVPRRQLPPWLLRLDQADGPSIADPVFQEPHQPLQVEELRNERKDRLCAAATTSRGIDASRSASMTEEVREDRRPHPDIGRRCPVFRIGLWQPMPFNLRLAKP
jgi:hypothetical protein